MSKSLDELTKEEWNTLFPITLEPHNPAWAGIFRAEKASILEALGPDTVQSIEHFGSTSIPGIAAKNYIDMLIEILPEQLFDEQIIAGLRGLGYHYFRQMGTQSDYMVFVKGYMLDGPSEQIFHIHMCTRGHAMWEQLKFRDYLREHPQRAQAYEALKWQLALAYKHDREGYRIAKTEFIQETMTMLSR